MNNFGDRLKLLRKNSNLTQVQLAKIANLRQSNINTWENNKSLPLPEGLTKLADALNCSIDYLLGREREDGIIEISGERVIPEKSQIQILFDKLNKANQFYLLCYGQGLFDGQ